MHRSCGDVGEKLHREAGSAPGLYRCLHPRPRPSPGRERHAASFRGQPAIRAPDGAHAGASRPNPPPAGGGAQHRGAPRPRRPARPMPSRTRQILCAEELGDSERADDLVQETLLGALEKWDRFEPGTNLQAWAFTLMRNLFYSDYRQRRSEVEDVDGLFAADVSIPPEQPSRIEFAELRSALMRLPAEQREAVLLVGAEGYSYEEAAVICA